MSNTNYRNTILALSLVASATLSGCGSSASVATPTDDSSTSTTTSTTTYLSSTSPSSGEYSNIPTTIFLTFSGVMGASVTSTSNWLFYCGSSNYGVTSVSGSGTIYTVTLPAVSPSSGTTCTLTGSNLVDSSGDAVNNVGATYIYDSSATGTGGTTTTPAYTFDFSNTGPAGTYTATNIDTDNLLQVTVTLGQPTIIAGTGYTAEYSCAQFMVTVLGQSQTVFLSNTGEPGYGYCEGALVSQMLDFSSRLTSGHGAVSVTVTNVSYDNCRLYGDVYGYGCPQTAVYTTHTLTGELSIAVNSD